MSIFAGAKKWTAFMLFLTIALFSSAMTGIVLLYHFYPTECAFNNAATTTTLVFSVLNLGITISPLAEHGSVLVGSLIFLYSTYLAFATVSAYPEEQCNPFVQDSGDDKVRRSSSRARWPSDSFRLLPVPSGSFRFLPIPSDAGMALLLSCTTFHCYLPSTNLSLTLHRPSTDLPRPSTPFHRHGSSFRARWPPRPSRGWPTRWARRWAAT